MIEKKITLIKLKLIKQLVNAKSFSLYYFSIIFINRTISKIQFYITQRSFIFVIFIMSFSQK